MPNIQIEAIMADERDEQRDAIAHAPAAPNLFGHAGPGPGAPNPFAPVGPGFSPEVQKDLEAWLAANQLLEHMREKLKKLAAALSHMGNTMLGVIEVMGAFQDVQGAQLMQLSAVSNLGSDISAQISAAQNAFNNGTSNENNSVAAAKQLMQIVAQIQDFLKYEQSQGGGGALSPATAANLESALQALKGAFGPSWGNPVNMAKAMVSWGNNSTTFSPEFKAALSAFSTLNQSVSALSASTGTAMQFKTQQINQGLGTEETAIKALQTLTAQEIRNQKSQ